MWLQCRLYIRNVTYLGPMWVLRILPIVGQGFASSTTAEPCYQDCTDRWIQNGQHFPPMLLVPQLWTINKFKQSKIKHQLRAHSQHKCMANNNWSTNTYSIAIRTLASRGVIVGWHGPISMVVALPNSSMIDWLATSFYLFFTFLCGFSCFI